MRTLHGLEALKGFAIAATDGEIGHVKDVFFDDQERTIRYLVVDTGGWLSGRLVLISPSSIKSANWNERNLAVNLSKQQVEDSPGIDTEKPVSRQHEVELYNYYGYPFYWTGPFLWGDKVFPALVNQVPFDGSEPDVAVARLERERAQEDAHLHSANEVIGYRLKESDDEIGHVEDFLFDDASWKIELLVADTRNWLPGKHVLISPSHIVNVDWGSDTVEVDVTRAKIESSPEYDPKRPPSVDSGDSIYQSLYRD